MNFIKNNLLILCVVLSSIFSNAQTSAREVKQQIRSFYSYFRIPLKRTKWTGVLPVKNVNDKPK
jgi:hypothetical protein